MRLIEDRKKNRIYITYVSRPVHNIFYLYLFLLPIAWVRLQSGFEIATAWHTQAGGGNEVRNMYVNLHNLHDPVSASPDHNKYLLPITSSNRKWESTPKGWMLVMRRFRMERNMTVLLSLFLSLFLALFLLLFCFSFYEWIILFFLSRLGGAPLGRQVAGLFR